MTDLLSSLKAEWSLAQHGSMSRVPLYHQLFEREEPDHAAINCAFAAVGLQPAFIGLGHVERHVGRQRGFPHRRTTGKDDQVGRV